MTESHQPHRTSRQTIGEWGEILVSQWVQQLGWQVLHHRWRCRWGELDIVAQTLGPTPMLIVVEVKVRKPSNWDHTGLLAITPQKQHKLLQAAALFLAEHDALGDYPCRFDVALVERKPQSKSIPARSQGREHPTPRVAEVTAPKTGNINALAQDAIAPFLGSPSAPSQAIQASQIPCMRVGNEILRLQHYLEGAFSA